MKRERIFSDADLERVQEAVREAEAKTSGEIVPYFVETSDHYGEAAWRGGLLGALGAVLVAAIVHQVGGFWGGYLPLWMALPAAVGAVGGFLAVGLVPAVKRRLVPHEDLERRVELRAAAAFIEQEVFATRDRTGILLFLSGFERRVLVMADAGIHAKVEQGEWDGLVADLAAGLRAGRAAEALVEAIGRCGHLLERLGVERRPDDVDELPDELRTRER